MKPGARITDPHSCALQSPVPHVGGPITGPGAPKVLLEQLVGSVVGDACVCVGGPDATAKSSRSVMYQGKFAVRKGDVTAHGGVVTGGAGTVLVGD